MITLKQFAEKRENIAIHCNTLEKAKILCNAMDELGMRWGSLVRYKDETHWDTYEKNTCYTNWGSYSDYEYFERNSTFFKLYEFEDIIDFTCNLIDICKMNWLYDFIRG